MAGAKEPEASSGVDPADKIIDPTKNVLDLVKAESKYQDGMRDALRDFQNAMRAATDDLQSYRLESEAKFQNGMRDAESKRTDQLSDQRRVYETRIADMLRASVESTSTLVSNQLVQIQNTFNDRVAKLEQFRYESVGKAGVADPALAQALSSLGSGLGNIQTTMGEALQRMATLNADAMEKMSASIASLKMTDAGTEARSAGRGESWGWIVGGAGLVLTVLTIIGLLAAFALSRTTAPVMIERAPVTQGTTAP